MAERPIDVKGSDIVSRVLLDLLNTYPGLMRYQDSGIITDNGAALIDSQAGTAFTSRVLRPDSRFQFSSLADKNGFGFFPLSGAVLVENRKSITGHVRQRCSYPFNIVYRAAPKSEEQKLAVKEWLDACGRWLELQPVTIYGQTVRLERYPDLDPGRIITSIQRSSPGHLEAAWDDGVQDWVITMVLNYKYEYDT